MFRDFYRDSRKRAIATLGCIPVMLAAAAQAISHDAAGEKNTVQEPRPNILWLTFEDTSPQFIGCYGDSMARTPVMDSLARDGVRFSSAFSSGTVSSPSRFCLITGMTPATMGTGNHRTNYPIPDSIKGFPYYLRQAGYYTTNCDKTDYNNGRHRQMTEESWNESSKKAGWWNRRPGQPFFAVFNSMDSHQSRTMTNPWEIYEEKVLQPLDSARHTAVDASFEMPSIYRDTPEMRKHMSRVYNAISLSDQRFGEILDRLDREGLRDSTIIFCFSDHGEGIPRGKGSSLGMGYRVPFIVWVPEMYSHLSPWGSGTVTDRLVSFEDFAATVLNLAGVDIPAYIEGQPFMGKNPGTPKSYSFGACDGIDGSTETSRSVTDGRYMYTRVFTPFQPFVRWNTYFDHSDIQKQMRADYEAGLMDSVQRSIMEPRPNEFLFDLRADKWETHNLAEDQEYRPLLEHMRKLMLDRAVAKRDANFIPEYDLYAYAPDYIPNTLRMNDSIYPVERVMEAAMLSGEGEPALRSQMELLADPSGIVTCWAAVGLFGSRGLDTFDDETVLQIIPAVQHPIAKIYLGAALFDRTGSPEGKQILEDALLSENTQINLAAMHMLLNISLDRAKELIGAVHRHNERYATDKAHDDVRYYMNVVRKRLENKDFRFSNYW